MNEVMALEGKSIVIPAYNEEAFLPANLKSVAEAIRLFEKSTGHRAEIVVVNNKSTDLTHEVAQAHGANVILHEIRNISSARSAGIRNAKHGLIVAIDADYFLPSDSLIKIWQFMQDDSHAGVGSKSFLIRHSIAPSQTSFKRLSDLSLEFMARCLFLESKPLSESADFLKTGLLPKTRYLQ